MADQAVAVEADDEDVGRPQEIVLHGRYRIDVSAPLTAFDTPTARAFAALDLDGGSMGAASPLFARINQTGLAARDWEIEVLRELRHPHLMALIDIGPTAFAGSDHGALAVVLDDPGGGRLMASQGAKPMPFRDLSQRVLTPLLGALNVLHEHNVFHRAIHPHNLFLGQQPGGAVILGECASSAAGHNLEPAFQPLERASAAPLATGAGDRPADIYSLGVTIAALLAGRIPGADRDPDALLEARLAEGSLAALCGSYRFPCEIERLLAGMLADDPDQRWTLSAIENYLSGRRINIAVDRNPAKPSRIFSFMEEEFHNPIAIAAAFNRNWGEAITAIQSAELEKWLASNRNSQTAADMIAGLRDRNAANSNKMTSDALVSRACMVLDPKGPIRFKGMAVCIDGLGALLAHAFIDGRPEIASNIAAIIDQGLPGAWIATTSERRQDMAADTSLFMRLRQYIRASSPGYGIERCLYELNPALGCLHPLIDPVEGASAAALLTALDENFTDQDGDPPWAERHIAAYLTTRLHPTGDSLLASMRAPGRSEAAACLALVALAQEQLGVPRLPKLTRNAASSLYELIDAYHSKSRRQALRAALDRQLDSGDFVVLLKRLKNSELQDRDHGEYYAARNHYTKIGGEISRLKNSPSGRRGKAAKGGRRVAAWTAFMGLMAVSLIALAGLGG